MDLYAFAWQGGWAPPDFEEAECCAPTFTTAAIRSKAAAPAPANTASGSCAEDRLGK